MNRVKILAMFKSPRMASGPFLKLFFTNEILSLLAIKSRASNIPDHFQTRTFIIWLDVPGPLSHLPSRSPFDSYFSTKRQERKPRGGVAGCVTVYEGPVCRIACFVGDGDGSRQWCHLRRVLGGKRSPGSLSQLPHI